MIPLRLSLLLSLALVPALAAQDGKDEAEVRRAEDVRDASALRKVTDRVYIHDAANMSFTLPEGWTAVPPHSLPRKIDPRVTSVLTIKQPSRDVMATLYWMKLNKGQSLGDWVRSVESGGEYGEEYETLRTIYGKNRVTEPVKARVGEFDTYRIDISAGADQADKHEGVLVMFANEWAGETWMVKVRMSFPKQPAAPNSQAVAAVLEGFKKNPDRTAPEFKKKLFDLESTEGKSVGAK